MLIFVWLAGFAAMCLVAWNVIKGFDKMKCPECDGPMQPVQTGFDEVIVLQCKVCGYTEEQV